jgi:hypothetical protein
MSDAELIAQLKNSKGWPTLGKAAAARIEALEQHVADLLVDVPCACGYDNPTDVCMKHLPLVRDLTDKLAKAAEALREIAAVASVPVHTHNRGGINFKKMYEGWRKVAVQRIDKARAALAEIEGKKT